MKNNTKEIDESFLQIDEKNLEKEWVEQPAKYFKYARRLANARNELEEAKAEFELTKAEIATDIRNNPGKYELPKVVNDAVEAAMLQTTEYAAALSAVNKQKHRVDIYQAAVTSLDHRKKALEKLVELFMADYFSSPRAPAGAKDAMNDAERRSIRRGSK